MLRTFLGTAPGVGKTYAMLNDGRRAAGAGQRVVVGWIERHGRAETRAQLGDLEIIPPRMVDYRGGSFEELDLAAVVATRPDIVLVDELAHSHADGSGKRWEDVRELLANGLSVMTTVNVANLFSVRDYAALITGAGTVECVPDELVRSGEVVLVDLPPEALRRRIVNGSVYTANVMGGALSSYFRTANLEALSRLARAWVDGTVDDVGPPLLVEAGLEPLARRSTVVAGVSGSEWGEVVIRRAAELAAEEDADLVVVHVNIADGRLYRDSGHLDRYRAMTAEAGGTYTEVSAPDAVEALVRSANALNATHVVVARHRSRLGELVRGSVASRAQRLLPNVEVDVVTRADAAARS